MPQQQRQQQHTFKITIGGVENDDDDDDDDGQGGFGMPPPTQSGRQQTRLKVTGNNYLSSGSMPQTIQPATSAHSTRRTMQIGNKDLIIRMLAEIFQVRQDENGLVRWQQISTSLVPISLYSRTTSKWLDYLLAASASIQTHDPANAMSPDSRDFLLLLQQFHQQTRPTIRLNQFDTMNKNDQAQYNESIVFQVIGHDVINGQCKKILNVKLKQPGTRLGQASDFFVYWREQPSTTNQKLHNLHHQQFSASSFASNNSFMQQTPKTTAQLLNHPASNLSRRLVASDVHQTWGLNFASINDAKLFYDICSLNLVDLDFNSEYLKQLAIRDTTQYQQQNETSRKIPMATNSLYPLSANCTRLKQQNSQLQLLQLQHQYQLQQQQQQQRLLRNKYQKMKQQSTKNEQIQHRASARGQISMSRCPSCKQAVDSDQKKSTAHPDMRLSGNFCPVHGNDLKDTIRMRSRSTTRQLSTATKENENFKRARSFSTPVSPEPDQCPVHRRRHRVNTDCKQQQICAQLQRDQQLEQIKSNITTQDTRPQKPARGHLRQSQAANSQERSSNMHNLRQQQQNSSQAPLVNQSSLIDYDQVALNSKKNQQSRYMALHNLTQQQQPDQRRKCKQQIPSVGCHGGESSHQIIAVDNLDTVENVSKKIRKQMQQGISGNLSSFQTRAQTDTETFDAIARRDARLARARYANSKNMKEFLSLDAGGLQSTPTQQRFLRQHIQNKPQEEQSKLTDNNIKLAGGADIKQELAEQYEPRKQAINNKKPRQAAKQSIQSGGNELLSAIGTDRGYMTDNACQRSIQYVTTRETGDAVQCNASTTTDDLPMDISTRRRMLKLTSEEVISERTEPKSISISTGIAPKSEQDVSAAPMSREEKIDRQVRAVSLGPEFSATGNIRGRVARSDASRRRSLERSTCVDLDASLPASSFMKCTRLSPLPQSSSSPQGLAAGCDSSKSPNSCSTLQRGGLPARILDGPNITSMMEAHHNELNDLQLDGIRRETKSYGLDGQNHSYQLTDLGDGQSNSKCALDDRQFATCHERQMFVARQLATFKSAPDIRLPELERVNDMTSLVNSCDPNQPAEDIYLNAAHHLRGQTAHSDLTDNSLKYKRQIFNDTHIVTGLPRGRSNLSSYAVPLCSTVKRPPQQTSVASRQCQSCPSSLRRKRAQSARSDVVESELVHDCFTSPMCSHRYPHACLCRQMACPMNENWSQNTNLMHPHCDCFVSQTDNIMPYHNSGCPNCETLYSNLPSAHGQHYSSQQRSYCNHNRTYHQHCSQSAKDSLSYVKMVALNSDQSQPMQSFRSHSSQSNRSQMQYGLYESDFEDELVRIEQECIEPPGDYNDSFSRSQSAYFQPTMLKPVQGYDQTMARVALKSRQRSRSQPPGCSTDAKNSFHLTKSMENVEKLIKEVQNELRALKRQPLGTAHIDMTTKDSHQSCNEPAPKTIITVVPKTQENLSTKMSLDENENNQRDQSDNKFSCTSATRKAGQFKCVGAIRKAGFLSVKKWILKRRQSIELARKQGWKRYWVCLRGTALLFHSVIENRIETSPINENLNNQTDLLSWIQMNCSSQTNFITNLLQTETAQKDVSRDTFFKNMSQVYIEKEPRHLIIIDGSIAQPIPEHPRRDNVFCLSTTFGDAYLFQASCQLESDNWISAIHNACAASIARDLTRGEAIKLFETKIRHFELEAEKKIFLRQRLESRLTSMSSICNVNRLNINSNDSDRYTNCDELNQDKNKITLRSLLYQLGQQLLALDTYIEQLRCEVYQLRCYLSSCGAQNVFYQNIQQQDTTINQTNIIPSDLPHPKSLLMHVSKSTKLLLIKLGIFTVSSFHAYIHARQDSAKTILQQIQQTTTNGNTKASCSESSLELRIRSHSISESLLSKTENVKLEDDTENLIELANLKTVSIQLSKTLIRRIKKQEGSESAGLSVNIDANISDDRFSIQDLGEYINLNIRLNPSSNSSSIITQVLKIIEPDLPELEFLNYYLRLVVSETNNLKATNALNNRQMTNFYIVKRKETLNDWSNFIHIELLEKIIFRIELHRSRMEEEAATPFGISVDGQLFSSKYESLLNVYCNYIEWGSVADKAGLQDEDEFLLINGIPVGDLDLMFVECIIQDANKLKAVVRSNATECPPKAVRLDKSTWRPLDDDEDNDRGGRRTDRNQNHTLETNSKHGSNFISASSQIISDEYLTSLVCPPPPAKSSAFLRTDLNMLRQKSDLGMDKMDVDDGSARMEVSNSVHIPKSKSQHRIDVSRNSDIDTALVNDGVHDRKEADNDSVAIVTSSVDLAKQLLKRTERLTKLLGKDPINDADKLLLNVHLSSSSCGSKAEHNHLERLQKSILELIETEYAYIRHLETISEHYMSPLEETGFLNIGDLKSFNRIVLAILRLQREFFDLLTTSIAKECKLNINESDDEFERFNVIIQQTDAFKTIEDLRPIVASIAKLFQSEADKFKIYTSYCAAYSKLQKILHPKNSNGSSNLPGVSITLIPNTLNAFSNSLTANTIGGLGHFTAQQRDSRLVNLTVLSGNSDQNVQLKQLTEFLGNLDSSSSSVSLSLAKSSDTESMSSKNQKSKRGTFTSNSLTSAQSAAGIAANSTYQKSVHQQNFESYLIKPIQRIVKYPMLLNSIGLAAQAYYSNVSSTSDLKCAIKHMEVIVNHVNDMQRVHDEYGLAFDHIEKQYFDQQALEASKTTVATLFGPHQPAITLDVSQLLYFAPVEWLNMSEFSSKAKRFLNLNSMLFVFDSCVVFMCKECVRSTKRRLPLKNNEFLMPQQQIGVSGNSLSSKVFPWSMSNGGEQFTEIVRYQTLIPVSEVQVRSVPVDQQATFGGGDRDGSGVAKSQDAKYQWELFQCSSSNSNSSLLTKATSTSAKRANTKNETGKVYLLSSPSNEERSTFLRKIRFIIRESVRNMSLPLPRSPSSKSLTSKKLSTSSATSATSNTNINSSCSQAASLSPPPQPPPSSLDDRQQGQAECEPYSRRREHTKADFKSSIEVQS